MTELHSRRSYRISKRCMDVLLAGMGLIVFAPVMAALAILIRASIGSPVIFRHPRPGLSERIFPCLKFRTMTNEADSSGELLPDTQRLTRLGKLIRKTSLDELPQLWSVLIGDMSLVGPRPLEVRYLPRYSPEQRRRHSVKPGITGWAQVNGRNHIDWEEKLALDIWYVSHCSFLLDLKILALTVSAVLMGTGIAKAGQASMEEFWGAAPGLPNSNQETSNGFVPVRSSIELLRNNITMSSAAIAMAGERSTIRVPLSAPDITDQDRQRVLEVLSGSTLSLGPWLPAFEAALADAAGTRFAVAVNSGTSALHLCVKGAGIGEGDEVITSPFSFVASANCMLFERAIPRFVDIDIDTYNLNTELIPANIGPRTKGILPVHVFGRPCDMRAIVEIASLRGLTVIEDACEAIGATINGRRAGGLGDSGAFGFYPNKQITTGEGGAVVTNDERLAKLCRSWRNQGRNEDNGWLQHDRLGYNYRISDVNCAMGLGQLLRLESILQKRRRVAEMYSDWLSVVPEVVRPSLPAPGTSISWFVYVIRLQDDFTRDHRDRILTTLNAAGIGCRNYFSPIHLQPFYREMFGYRRGDFPVTEFVADRSIALPFHNNLAEEQISRVTATLAGAVRSLRKPVLSFSQLPVKIPARK